MSDKNLFLGDTIYPHTKEAGLVERLRGDFTRSMYRSTDAILAESAELRLLAADRIEQLERELAGYKDAHLAFMKLGMKHGRLLLNHENLCAELAEVQKDKLRLDFIESHTKFGLHSFDGGDWTCSERAGFQLNRHKTARLSIDAAIQDGK